MLFPDLLYLTIFAHALMRVVLAGMFGYNAWKNGSKSGLVARVFALFEAAVASALFVGAWTQGFALLAVILLGISLFRPEFRTWPRSTIVLMLVMALALMATGPGALAFDWPL